MGMLGSRKLRGLIEKNMADDEHHPVFVSEHMGVSALVEANGVCAMLDEAEEVLRILDGDPMLPVGTAEIVAALVKRMGEP